MKKNDLHIPEPCDMNWEEMAGDDQRRFCDQCTKNVHNLSEMSKDEALDLVKQTPRICVQYATDVDTEEILFKDSTSITARLYRQGQGLGKLLAAAALVVPLLAGCQEPTTPQSSVASEVVAPIQANQEGRAVIKPGASKAPNYTESAEEVVGKINVPTDHAVEEITGDLVADEEDVELKKGELKSEEYRSCDPPPEEVKKQATPPDLEKKIRPPRVLRGRVARPKSQRHKSPTKSSETK